MATVTLNHVQFWQPPSKPSFRNQRISPVQQNNRSATATNSRYQPVPQYQNTNPSSKRSDQSHYKVAAARGHDSTAQLVPDRVNAQDHIHDPNTCDGAADDELPPMEDITYPPLRKDISAEGHTLQYSEEWTLNTNGSHRSLPQPILAESVDDSQGTRDSPVILEDDEPHSPGADPETPSGPTPEQAAPARAEAWWDVEDMRWVDDQHPLPPREQEGLAGSSHINPYGQGENVQGTSEDPTPCHQSILSGVYGGGNELAPRSVPKPLDEDGDDNSSSDLKRDLLLAFEEQEKLASAAAPSSLAHRRSTGLLQNQGNSYFQGQITCTRTEEPRDTSEVRTLDECQKTTLVAQQGAEGGWEEQQHEGEEDVVGLMDGREMQRQQQHGEESELDGEEKELDELEEEDGSDNPEDEDYNCDSIDEEDEDIRPAKRRRRSSPLSDESLEDRGQQNAKPDVSQPRRSLSTATERDHVQPKTVRTRARNSTADDQLYTPHPSWSPSDTTESMQAAEYREWPLHGFLKSTRIGNDTTFNLEFHLVGVPEHLELSAPWKALCNNDQLPIKPRKLHSTMAHSKAHNSQSTSPRKRAPWTTEEDTTLVKMKEENCSWEEIFAALPAHSQGSIQVRYSTKFSKRSSAGTRSRKRQRP